MIGRSNIQIHECIFQFYLEHRLHGMCTGEVHNLLLGGSMGSLQRGEGYHRLNLIKDIPDYLDFGMQWPSNMKSIRIPQYYGYLVKLKGCSGIDEYLSDQMSKRNIKNLRAKKKKLERLGSVEYRVMTGPLDTKQYTDAFDSMQLLLKKRFDKKKILNRYLMDWKGQYDQALPRLMEKKALLFVILLDGKPVGMALDYILDSTVFSHIQTFDQEFSNYNLGDLMMYFQLEWSLEHGKSILDLSKGENTFKEKWCNHKYRLYHEVGYPKASLPMTVWAWGLVIKYSLIQKLRELGLLGNIVNVDKLLYKRYRRDFNEQIQAKGAL